MKLAARAPLLIAVAVVLPLLILGAMLLAFSARDQRRIVEAQALGSAERLVIAADAQLSRTLGALDALATAQVLRDGDLAASYARAGEIKSLNPDWVSVTLTDLAGRKELFDLRRPLASGSRSSAIGNPFTTGSRAVIGGIEPGGAGCPCVLVHRAMERRDGARFAITVSIGPQMLQQLVAAEANEERIVAIVDQEGRFIARSVAPAERLGKPGSTFLRGAIAQGNAGIYSGKTLEGFANYTAFATSRLSGWSAHIAFQPGLLDAPQRRALVGAGLAALAALALAALLIWLTLRQMAQERRLQRRMQDAQKMEALGQLTGGIAHDFNNLLTPIIGGLDLITRQGDLGARSQRLANGALDAARKAVKLSGQLLAFSRRQIMEIKPVDLAPLLEGIDPLLRQSAGPTVELELHVAEDARYVLSDPNQLELALLNLVVNARDAMPEGGRVRISASLREPDATRGEPEMVALDVQDDGTGMSEDVLRRCTEPFYTTKPTGSGTGLGLAQVYGIVQQSGGRVSIKSKVGEGTCVRLLLPVGERPQAAANAIAAATVAVPVTSRRILVCDDDDAVRSFVTRVLDDAGYVVEAVSDGRTAIESMRQAAKHLLIVDYAMHGMNGAEVAEVVRAEQPYAAILLITGYADTEAIDRLGIELTTLRKPFDAETLLASVRKLLG
jgi:signal transduction histidine kinase